MRQCSFDETIELWNGGFRRTKCINKAEILDTNDPCYGLCFVCAYRKLQTENKRLKEFIEETELEAYREWCNCNS
jgi:hypothetical protein